MLDFGKGFFTTVTKPSLAAWSLTLTLTRSQSLCQ